MVHFLLKPIKKINYIQSLLIYTFTKIWNHDLSKTGSFALQKYDVSNLDGTTIGATFCNCKNVVLLLFIWHLRLLKKFYNFEEIFRIYSLWRPSVWLIDNYSPIYPTNSPFFSVVRIFIQEAIAGKNWFSTYQSAASLKVFVAWLCTLAELIEAWFSVFKIKEFRCNL